MKSHIRSIYKESFQYLKNSKAYLIIIAAVFFLTLFIGYLFPIFFVEAIRELLKNLVDETEGMNFPQLFIYIFQNNLKTAFLGIMLGIFFGIAPLFYALTNGYILGFVASKAAEVFGPKILIRLLPHGIFELPALIISLALGLKLGTFLLAAKDKARGIAAYVVGVFSSIFIFIISMILFAGIGITLKINTNLEQLLENTTFLLLLAALFIISFLLGIFIASSLLVKKDRLFIKENLKNDFENALKTFLFIILPLLLIAGFIETMLITFFG